MTIRKIIVWWLIGDVIGIIQRTIVTHKMLKEAMSD